MDILYQFFFVVVGSSLSLCHSLFRREIRTEQYIQSNEAVSIVALSLSRLYRAVDVAVGMNSNRRRAVKAGGEKVMQWGKNVGIGKEKTFTTHVAYLYVQCIAKIYTARGGKI